MRTDRRVIGAAEPTFRLADPSPPPIGQARFTIHDLRRHLPRLTLGSVVVGVGEGIAGAVLAEPVLLGSAVLSIGFGLGIIPAIVMMRLGHDRWVAPLLVTNVFALGLLGAFLIPGVGPAAAMLPILSVVMLLPGRSRRGIAVVRVVAVVVSGLALVLAGLPDPIPALREPLGSVLGAAALLSVMVLFTGVMTDFSSQAQDSLDKMRRALRSHADASAERTAIVASLGRLERRDTIEATAGVFVDALTKLPDVDLAGVFSCEGHDLEVLALFGPPGFPVHAGDRMPEPRARHLLDRSRSGPWAERWTNDPAFEQYGEAFNATGVKGQAYAPFFSDGTLIGIVAIGTQSESHAEHLLTDLPAVAEFAATASLLLTPMLVARRETAAARAAIESIIAMGAYRPVFQPIVELETGHTVGYEALTRFVDGRRPDLVFAAAASAGLGFELELGTLEVALRAGRQLPGGTWLSLNVSPGLVVEAVGLARVLAQRDRPVVLEITEHVVIDDYRAVRAAVDRFGADVRVAVDDAGAGIANFSHLVELRPRLVKVDAGLIRDVDTDLARQAAVVGLVHFAAKAGCEVIAEGIETEAERATAHALGVTHGQGYLIARPASVSEFIEPERVAETATASAAIIPMRPRSRRVRVGFLDPHQPPAPLAAARRINGSPPPTLG
jgi:EAL domain-containing protein (putative c-di-GMP-specific phosphodiesterase class I)